MGVLSDGRRHTREDSGIRLDRDGQWWHDGQPIEHPKIIEAFNRGLSPTDDGRFRLQFGSDWCYVEVEDAAYRVLQFDVGEQGPSVELSDRTSEPLDLQTLSLDADGVVACQVKGRRAKARFSRDAQFALGERLTQRGEELVLDLVSKTISVPLRLRPQR
jgi:uncharacterized protein